MKAYSKTNQVTVLCAIALAGDGQAPSRIPLFPAPGLEGWIPARDGRMFRLTNPADLIASYNSDPLDAPIDYEHAQELLAPQGQEAPAAGWITRIDQDPETGIIYGDVEWTSRGQASVQSREYRYISPAFGLDPETREITSLLSAGLVNRPALTMPALTRVQDGAPLMKPETLKFLGLDDSATPEQIDAAVKALKAAGEAAVATAVEAAQAKTKAEIPQLANFVPRADYDAALARVATIEKAQADAAAAAHSQRVEVAIASALKAGKITPSTKDFYVQTCATQEGLKQFTAFVENAPVIAPSDVVGAGKPAPTSPENGLTEQDFLVAEKCGISRETLIASVKGK